MDKRKRNGRAYNSGLQAYSLAAAVTGGLEAVGFYILHLTYNGSKRNFIEVIFSTMSSAYISPGIRCSTSC